MTDHGQFDMIGEEPVASSDPSLRVLDVFREDSVFEPWKLYSCYSDRGLDRELPSFCPGVMIVCAYHVRILSKCGGF